MKEKEIYGIIEEAIAFFEAKIIEFTYDRKCFGDILVKILDKNRTAREYVLDRGDIYVGPILALGHENYKSKSEKQTLAIFVQCIIYDLTTRQ